MEYIYIGKIVNTHGIKGEVRIISDFEYKDKVFVKGMILYLNKKQQLKINTYRVHKNYDMVTFVGINDINEVLPFKGDNVYIDKNSIIIDGYFDEDLIGMTVIGDNIEIGKVEKIIKNKAHKIIVVSGNKMIPYVDEYIKDIDINNKTININLIKGLIDEN